MEKEKIQIQDCRYGRCDYMNQQVICHTEKVLKGLNWCHYYQDSSDYNSCKQCEVEHHISANIWILVQFPNKVDLIIDCGFSHGKKGR